MLAVGSNTGLLLRGLHSALGVVGQDLRMSPVFVPEKAVIVHERCATPEGEPWKEQKAT